MKTTDGKRKRVRGYNLFGAVREYDVRLLDAGTALRLFHETDFASMLIAAAEAIKLTQPPDENDEAAKSENRGAQALIVVKMFSGLMSWDVAEDLCRKLLAGAVVYTDDNEYQIGDDGKVRFAPTDPSEQYLALAHALFVNFPDYLPFFEGSVVEDFDRDGAETGDQGDE